MKERMRNIIIALMAIPVFVIMVKYSIFNVPIDWAGVYLIGVMAILLYVHVKHNVVKVKE